MLPPRPMGGAAPAAVGMGVVAAPGVGVAVCAMCGLRDVLERGHAIRGGYCVCVSVSR